jgi:basic amino acid/polyamine antiporter, APA family
VMSEQLERTLSFPVLLIIIVNTIMGTGIFLLPAVGAREAGVGSIISWIILSCFAVYISACMGELTSMFPNEGGVYEFCKQAYGRFVSFLIGWSTMIAGFITIAMLTVGAILILLPKNFSTSILGFSVSRNFVIMVISLAFIIFFHYMAYKGLKTSTFMLVTFGIICCFTVAGVIIPGLFKIELSNFSPILGAGMGMGSIYVALFFIAETFFGWEQATFLAGSTKDGKRVVPKALVIGTIIISVFSIALPFTLLGNINYTAFSDMSSEEYNAPIPSLGRSIYGDAGWDWFTILVYLSIIGGVASWIISAPNLLLAMAKDKLLFSQISQIHSTNKSPHKAIIFQGLIVAFIIWYATADSHAYELLLHILVPLVLFQYVMVILALVVLRRKRPDIDRPFKVPFPKWGPLITIVFLVSMFATWIFTTDTAMNDMYRVFSTIMIGIPVYFLIELYFDPKMIVKVNDRVAYLALLFEKVSVPKKVIDEIIYLLGDVKGSTILEYGCNVGTLTVNLSRAVGNQGKIIATDLSRVGLHITQKRIERALIQAKESIHGRVHIMHDEEHTNRVHPDIKKVDAIVSVGTVSYVQNMRKVLKEMYEILPDEGKIIIVEYADYLKFVPNVEWMAKNETIQDLFMDSGFSVRVIRKEGLFWNYIFIYGIKYTEDVVPFI